MKTPVVLVPAAGMGQRFQQAGYSEAKPFISVTLKGKTQTLIEHNLDSFPTDWPIFLAHRKEHKEKLTSLLKYSKHWLNFIEVEPSTEGPWLSTHAAAQELATETPTLVSYSDMYLNWNTEHFKKYLDQKSPELIWFYSHVFFPGPQRSFGLCRQEKQIWKIHEKTQPQHGDRLTTGLYFFKTKELLLDALKYQKLLERQSQGEYFTSMAMETLVQKNTALSFYQIKEVYQLGTPEDLAFHMSKDGSL